MRGDANSCELIGYVRVLVDSGSEDENGMSSLRGIFPALVTPFDAEERFQTKPMEALLQRVYTCGVHGVYVCGQTGEGLLQPVEQRKRVAEVAVRNTPTGKQVIVHVGSYRTADAVDLTRHASRIGARAVSSLAPLGNYSFPEIKAYYQAIAAVAEVPVLIYYFPEVCPGLASAEQILELASIPSVIGLKFTDYNLYLLSLLRREGLVVFNGRDEVLAAGMVMGASGGIGTFYNLVPDWFVKVYELSQAGKYAEAVQVQDRINELIRVTLKFPAFPAVKRALAWSGIDAGNCLGPRCSLSTVEESGLCASLRKSFGSECFPQELPVIR